MRLGVVFPQTEIGPDAEGVRELARGVLELGYGHLLTYEHVVGHDPARHGNMGPYDMHSAFHEPFVLFGFLAAAAPQLSLVTGVLVLPQRNAVLVAKQAAEVDRLTHGKFRLGVGIGWNPVEFEAMGADFKTRGRRIEEQIAVMRRLWKDELVDYQGQEHRLPGVSLNPRPVQQPIPVWLGGSAEKALQRAARLGDGFFPRTPLEGGWRATLDQMRRWREEAGLPWEGYGIEARLKTLNAGPDEWKRSAEEWRRLGASHLSVDCMGEGRSGASAHLERLAQVMQALNSG